MRHCACKREKMYLINPILKNNTVAAPKTIKKNPSYIDFRIFKRLQETFSSSVPWSPLTKPVFKRPVTGCSLNRGARLEFHRTGRRNIS